MNGIAKISALMILVMFGLANATYLQVQGPVNATLQNGQTIYLGKVGPGESLYVLASATTTNASGVSVNIGWDTLEAVSLPQGWTSQQSALYANPMKMKITVAPTTANGTYNMTLRAVNVGNYSKLGNLTFTAQVNVTPDVFELNVTPTVISTGIGQPTNLRITINNTGVSDDPFIINAYGLPAWNVSDEVIALHHTTNTYIYPVFINEPGQYSFNVTVASISSPLVHKQYTISLTAQASLLNDYSAIGQGVVLSPIIYEPSYALMQLLGYLYDAATGH